MNFMQMDGVQDGVRGHSLHGDAGDGTGLGGRARQPQPPGVRRRLTACLGTRRERGATWMTMTKIIDFSICRSFQKVADFYLKDVVLDNFFDEPGIEQLAVDIRLGILPVFRLGTSFKEIHFANYLHHLQKMTDARLRELTSTVLSGNSTLTPTGRRCPPSPR